MKRTLITGASGRIGRYLVPVQGNFPSLKFYSGKQVQGGGHFLFSLFLRVIIFPIDLPLLRLFREMFLPFFSNGLTIAYP